MHVCAQFILEHKQYKSPHWSLSPSGITLILDSAIRRSQGSVMGPNWPRPVVTNPFVYSSMVLPPLPVGYQCTVKTLGCDNGNCYDSSDWCDGVDQCGDGSDERDCRKFIYDNLRNIPLLKINRVKALR